MDWILLAVGFLLCVGTGIFVATEFTLVNLDRHELEARRAKGEKRLTPVINALKETSTHLSSAQLGITLTTLLTGYTMEPAITSLLGDWLLSIGVSEDWVSSVGAIIAMVVATFLSMVVGELIPKNFALALPDTLAKVVVPVQNAFTAVFRVPVKALNNSANWLIRRMGIEPKEELSGARTAEELSSLVRRSALVGVLDTDKAVLLNRTLRFSEHTADEVMTPRPRVTVIASDASVEELIRLADQTGFSRFPVIGEDIDDVIGVAHLKYAVAVPRERRSGVPVGAIKTDAVFVPETIELDALLGELRGEGYQLAIVLDEYGGTAGIVTLEDLVEEIVGELVDEHDHAHVDIIRTRDRISFDGLLRPDELRDRLNIDIDEDGPYETVAGFMMHQLARVPAVGDQISVNEGTLTVEEMEGRRISRIRFIPNDTYETREERIRREREADEKGARA
ncbi:hemolysin family protein [Gulosibacter molinativorax]|uniref:HlyC/CorC family transporter n=1 Tax=Gulosibacter molinativorax TaxID=256821 RepID=A0ABT7C535_9MICO|nr:hemolysin family protein [Gulosibacter molinativorax]MDJ1369912.1 HlyC/CorC family transporter [Gulosibacter molinativorax]QUY61881.1 TlyC family hemolysin [Gulosibacter molinativorax]